MGRVEKLLAGVEDSRRFSERCTPTFTLLRPPVPGNRVHPGIISHVVVLACPQFPEELLLNRCATSEQIRILMEIVRGPNPAVVVAVVQTLPSLCRQIRSEAVPECSTLEHRCTRTDVDFHNLIRIDPIGLISQQCRGHFMATPYNANRSTIVHRQIGQVVANLDPHERHLPIGNRISEIGCI